MPKSDLTSRPLSGASRPLAVAAIAAQLLFTLGWLVGGFLQEAQYSATRHDISDLGALTAQHAWVMLTAQGIAGAVTIAFALVALRPALAVPGRRMAVSAIMVALSVMGLDNLSDAFFRLDCRAMDQGCTVEAAMSSWQGVVHGVVGGITILIFILTPFALARRMRLAPPWRDLWRPTLAFGVVVIAVFVANIALSSSGLSQRGLALLGAFGVTVLAVRVLHLTSSPSDRRVASN